MGVLELFSFLQGKGRESLTRILLESLIYEVKASWVCDYETNS